MDKILEYMPVRIKNYIKTSIEDFYIENEIQEIRLRCNKPIVLKLERGIKILEFNVTDKEIMETFEKICENSVYSYKREICEGYITIKGGNRVGITGNCVIENGKVININYISSLNFRIAREKKNISKEIMKYIVNENKVNNTMIVSSPGVGKTTLLRDIIRSLSDEFKKTVGVVDERGEIAAMYRGNPQKDIGNLTDVISNVSKSKGMNMLIRSMAPDVIACDEIGSKEDVEAINIAICSGVKGIFTVHGKNLQEVMLNNNINKLLNKNIIEQIFILDEKNKGRIKEKYFFNNDKKEYVKFI